ncbi:hypothetical protein L2E82_29851 [Cichorium intybus]|uniref:Uncharacterized protein n=1 Tax=Cichorium intybus TaxID=13427 RepID=A0ACB9CYN5_CICIN|nr:hypothetical protein L2E82_29851 [Cichorium intybus]
MIELLMHKLKSGIPYYQRTAAREISFRSYENDDNRIIFAKAGAIPLLTDLLTEADSRTQEQAVAALFHLSFSEENTVSIVWSGALPGIVQVLKEGGLEARENAAGTILNLSLKKENRDVIGIVGAVPILVELVKERQGCIVIHKTVINILSSFSSSREARVAICKAEVVRILVEAIGTGYTLEEPQSEILELATYFLVTLSLYPEGNVAVGEAEVVPFLVEVIGSGSSESKKNAAEVLVNLGSRDQKYLVEAQEHGVIGKLMDMLQHGISSEKRRARDLLRLMPLVRLLL